MAITRRAFGPFAGLEEPESQDAAERIVLRYLSMLGRAEARDAVMGVVRSPASNEHSTNAAGLAHGGVLTSSGSSRWFEPPDAKLIELVAPAIEQYLR